MKGLSFIPEMARAALAGTKTNTRRVIVPQPDTRKFQYDRVEQVGKWFHILADKPQTVMHTVTCDYQAGERRCLITTWAVANGWDGLKPSEVPANIILFWHAGMGEKPPGFGKSRPGRFLPNHLRHLMPVFEIVNVRAERVQAISTADIEAEGVTYPVAAKGCPPGKVKPLLRITGKFPPGDYMPCIAGSKHMDMEQMNHDTLLRAHWASLWDTINANRGPGKAKKGYGWSFNPWVWRVEFRKITT
jgi:hypothetical protein